VSSQAIPGLTSAVLIASLAALGIDPGRLSLTNVGLAFFAGAFVVP
jgi:hypothetical protein